MSSGQNTHMGPEIPPPTFLSKALGPFPHNANLNERAQPKQLEMG